MARSVCISTSLAPGPTRRDGSGWPGVAVERRPRETVSWRFSNPGEMPEFCDPFRGRPEILVVAFRGSRRLDRPATFWQASGLRSRAFGFSPRLNRFTRFGCGALGQRRPTFGGMARWDSDALPLGGVGLGRRRQRSSVPVLLASMRVEPSACGVAQPGVPNKWRQAMPVWCRFACSEAGAPARLR